jgi:hypothetical protein
MGIPSAGLKRLEQAYVVTTASGGAMVAAEMIKYNYKY